MEGGKTRQRRQGGKVSEKHGRHQNGLLGGTEESSKRAGNGAVPCESSVVAWYQRQDVLVWAGGMVFITALMGAIYTLGNYRGWNAPNGFFYDEANTTRERFLPEPFVQEPGVKGRYWIRGMEPEIRWYFWKLRPELVTPWTRLFVWVCYTVHQLLAWWLLYLAQVNKQSQKGKKYSTRLSKYNWAAVAVHTFFHLLHLAQTHLTYDATAQDVSIFSSQGSVIVALLLMMVIEFQDRGVFFGWPSIGSTDIIGGTLRSSTCRSVTLIRKYHGYIIMWAAVFTFWYHPMENTLGHVMGFVNTWIFMLQGGLVYTDMHLNKYWRFILETWVALHGAIVAYQTGGPTGYWPMFTFGFSALVVFTQLFTLPFWKRLPTWTRSIPALAYLAMTLYTYSGLPDKNGQLWTRLWEPIIIPFNQYFFALAICGLVTLCLNIETKFDAFFIHKNLSRLKANLGSGGIGSKLMGRS
ncbi:Hypp6385 [Branchiostoma lanceolatum]|uniref:Hypp6385 protein n=1 Tax=Branchiostoma lanceolatum TaxID=7740 RepID=A0A8K0EA18_BRALA|nr:Hypp6385 [Branchiostoma lanceolatum]